MLTLCASRDGSMRILDYCAIYATETTAELLPLIIEDVLNVGASRDKKLIQALPRTITKNVSPCRTRTGGPLTY